MNKNSIKSNIIFELQDYMFTSKNIDTYTKHMKQIDVKSITISKPFVSSNKEKPNIVSTSINQQPINQKPINQQPINQKPINQKHINQKKIQTKYKPRQKDTLFWCFYILKNGFSNFEMEINNQYFVVEKNEKFRYIELLRQNKNVLKIHKIKPLTELEDDLANKTNISIKTFFALCILENINILLVDKRKICELLCHTIDKIHPINIIHKINNEFFIELEPTDTMIQMYKDTYYKMNNFDSSLKSMASYKLDELIELCNKLNLNIEEYKNKKETKKKLTKKDIYELLVLNY
jgi:hypothetical protein